MRGEEIRVAVGSRDGKTRQPEARLVCRVISRAANISDETEVIPWTKLIRHSSRISQFQLSAQCCWRLAEILGTCDEDKSKLAELHVFAGVLFSLLFTGESITKLR